jgi:hypothetical protein
MAENPVLSSRSSTETDSTAKWSYFSSILILVAGSIIYSTSQIRDQEAQLADLTLAVDQMQPQVKQSDYERGKLYSLAQDVLRLGPYDRNAAQIVSEYKLRTNPAAQAQ